MKRLVQLKVAVVAIGLLAVFVWQASRPSANFVGSAQPVDSTPAQDQLAANLTDQFLNQLDAYSSH